MSFCYSDLNCPITDEIIQHPVILLASGHTFERTVIEEWLSRNSVCPITKEAVQSPEYAENRTLQTVIQSFLSRQRISHRHLQCPLTHQMFVDPVVLVESGYSFEREAIQDWLMHYKVCPKTGQAVTSGRIVQNWALKKVVQTWHGKQEVPVLKRRGTFQEKFDYIVQAMGQCIPVRVLQNLLQEFLDSTEVELSLDLRNVTVKPFLDYGCSTLVVRNKSVDEKKLTLRNGRFVNVGSTVLHFEGRINVDVWNVQVVSGKVLCHNGYAAIAVCKPSRVSLHECCIDGMGITRGARVDFCAKLHMTSCDVHNCVIGVVCSGRLSMRDCGVSNNLRQGVLIFARGHGKLWNCMVRSNQDGVKCKNGRLNITRCDVTRNVRHGIISQDSFVIEHDVTYGNNALGMEFAKAGSVDLQSCFWPKRSKGILRQFPCAKA